MFSEKLTLAKSIREQRPLVLNITNFVTMDFIANGLLALGASPIMSLAREELAELITIANTVVINIGTITPEFFALAREAAKLANQHQKPWVLDPVGAGASQLRTQASRELAHDYQPHIICGNASEIMATAGRDITARGVDNASSVEHALDAAHSLTSRTKTTVVISGAEDVILDNARTSKYTGGSSIMPSITGTGCLLTAVCAAFTSVAEDAFTAGCVAVEFYNHCAEQAALRAQLPGSFKVALIDAMAGFSA